MKILVIGGGGMVGVKLINRLSADGKLGNAQITKIVRHDVVLSPPPPASSFPIETLIGDLSIPGEAEKLVADRPDVIFHLAAIVSGEAEANFEKGYQINLDGTRYLFEAIRHAGSGYKPKLIFTSSIAVFGAPFPEAIPDDYFCTPLTSYGTQKAICELLLADYSRRASSMAWASAFRRSACGLESPISPPRVSSPTSFASLWPDWRRCFRSARMSATGTPRRAPPSVSCCMPRPWTARFSGRAGT